MIRTVGALFLVLTLAGPSFAQNLIANGDFEQPLDVGWTDTARVENGTYLIERTDTLGQSTGYAARVYKYLARYASLHQTVDVPGPNLTLSFDARLRIGGGSPTCWPAASVWVRYLDAGGLELGNTRFYLHDTCTWVNSDTVHLIDVPDSNVWHHYTLDVANELATNLPGVNPANVSKLTIDLYAYDNGT